MKQSPNRSPLENPWLSLAAALDSSASRDPTQGPSSSRAPTQDPSSSRASTQDILSSRAATQDTSSSRAPTQDTSSSRAQIQDTSSSRAPTQDILSSRAPIQHTLSESGRVSLENRTVSRASSERLPRIRPVPAVSRSIAILRLLGKTRDPLGVNAIAQALSLVPSTCLHILRALVEEKLVTVDRQTKLYRLGIGMLALARSALDTHTFPTLIQAGLDELSIDWNVTAIAVDVSDPDQMAVVALSRSTIPFRLHVDVGSVFPSLLSATGRLVAAFSGLSRQELKQRFEKLRWDGPLDFETWYIEVMLAAQNGYSIDRGTYIRGVTIVAVPVRQPYKRLTHTLVCASLANQLPEEELTKLIHLMKLRVDLAVDPLSV